MKEEKIMDEHAASKNGSKSSSSSASASNSVLTAPDLIGRVASPPRLESTSDQFYFWVQRDRLVEKTQIVRVESEIAGRTINFYGVIDEVKRRSRKHDISEEFDSSDGDVNFEPEFKPEGVTYASVSILQAQPSVLTPPIEQSKVYLGGAAEADVSYGFYDMNHALPVGQLRKIIKKDGTLWGLKPAHSRIPSSLPQQNQTATEHRLLMDVMPKHIRGV